MSVTVSFSGTAPLITTQELPSGIKGHEYSAYIDTSGDALRSLDISGLPEGLRPNYVLSSVQPFYVIGNGITGIPTVSGSYDVTVFASNDYGQDTKTFTLYIDSGFDPVRINAENFPDSVFRTYIMANYDTNHDGELDEDEINNIETFPANFSYTINQNTNTRITITNPNSLNITNLKGIEYFTALKTVCLPEGVTEADLSNKVSLDAFFMNGAKLVSLDLSGDTKLKVLYIMQYLHIARLLERPACFPLLQYLNIESGDLTQLDLQDNTNLEWVNIGEQYASADLISADNAGYPYAFDFRIAVSEDNLPKILRDSIVVLDDNGGNVEYLFDNWVLRFKVRPAVIKYKYDVGALNITMDVVITIRYEYLIVRPEITITNDDVPEGEQGKDYSFDITVTGTGPFRWVITGGNLPNGLTLDENTGRITGRPIEHGSFTVTITVSNSLYSVSITITIYIRLPSTRPSIIVPTISDGTVGVRYSVRFRVSGTGPFTWSLSDNPSWITINSSTGVLSGTPTSAGTFTFTVIVTDTGTGLTASYEITIIIGPASQRNTLSITTTSITTTSITSGTINVYYNFVMTASGSSSITWRIISGALPDGLTLNVNNGIISGTPTRAGEFRFTLEISAPGAVSVTREFKLIIMSRISITTSALNEGTINVSYRFRFTAAGTGTIIWRVSEGSLPAGLIISTSGEITGTPTVSGTFRFKIIAENEYGYDEKEFTLIIKTGSGNDGTPPDIITAYTLRDGFIGISYSVSLYAEGTHAISWKITGGNLPPGLTLNNNGTVTGIPTTIGVYTFTVEAVNNWGKDTESFVINIYTQDSYSNNDNTGIIYENRRTIESLTAEELAMIPGNIYIIAAVMPRFRVTVAGTYQFRVNIYQTVQTGLTLVWFPFAVNGLGGGTARFLNSSNIEITTVPNNRVVIVSVYLDVGTYAPVIAVLRPDEPADPESPDIPPDSNVSSKGGGGGGCYTLNSGILLLSLILIRRR